MEYILLYSVYFCVQSLDAQAFMRNDFRMLDVTALAKQIVHGIAVKM